MRETMTLSTMSRKPQGVEYTVSAFDERGTELMSIGIKSAVSEEDAIEQAKKFLVVRQGARVEAHIIH